MKIEIGKSYVDGWGKTHKIGGLAKSDLIEGEVVYYSVGGFWFLESGRATTTYSAIKGEMAARTPKDKPSNWDLKELVEDDA